MGHELHTLITALLPPTCAVRLTEVTMEQASVRLQAHGDGADRRLPALCLVVIVHP
jgi:hypothetical protein